ncbi:MAG: hypothetical protein ABIH57_00675 [Candidatus Omnitrophota bacterium]
MKKKFFLKFLIVTVLFAMFINLSGCAALKKKFTPKGKKKQATPVYYKGVKYDIKPSIDLYEKHYIFWINWQRKLIETLGKNFKSDMRCIREIIGNIQDMENLLVDQKAASLLPHIEELKKARTIIDKRNLTTSNETRVRRILEVEYRVIKREYAPKKMNDFIREDWKKE